MLVHFDWVNDNGGRWKTVDNTLGLFSMAEGVPQSNPPLL
jgi:hypothetical protein